MFKKYPADKLFLTLYCDNIENKKYRVVYLYKDNDLGYYNKKYYLDLLNNNVVCSLTEKQYENTKFIQDKQLYVNNYNICELIKINDAAVQIGYKEKENYTIKEAQILTANFNQICLFEKEKEKRMKLSK